MDPEWIYNFLNIVVLPFWLMMILAPRWEVTRRTMSAIWPFAIVPIVYVGAIGLLVVNAQPMSLDFSLSGITAMIGSEHAVLVFWAHMIALDFFAARWVYHDSQGLQVAAWITSLFILAIMMAGPAGLLAYFCYRMLRGKGTVQDG